jgi:uncharacterized protein (TIGR03437 family)
MSNRILAISFLIALNLAAQTPQISPGGVVGAGLSSPSVAAVSANGLVTIFGANFAPNGTVRDVTAGDIQNGQLPTSLNGVCVQFGGVNAPVINLRPNQINAQAPALPSSGTVGVQVVTNCGGANPIASNTVQVPVQTATPEFFLVNHDAGANNQVAGSDATSGSPIGSIGIIAGFNSQPALAGDVLTLFATGLGPTQPALAPGQLAPGAAPITSGLSMTIGGEDIPAANIQYAGISPTYAGLYQINVLLPADIPEGLQPVTLTVAGVTAPAAAIAVSNGPCQNPTITTFTAFPNQLPAAGSVTLGWDTDADSVDITQVGSGLDPGSTASFQVSNSITLTLTAHSVCGVATQSLLIAVGPPALHAIAPLTGSGTPTSAAPGDLLSFTFTNLADPTTVSTLIFRSASGLSVASQPVGVAEDGSIQARVPLLADMTQTSGYDTGSFFVSAVAGDVTSPEVPFTVLPLPAVADPVGTFRNMLDSIFGQLDPALAQAAASPSVTDIVNAVQPGVTSQETLLRQIASDLAASGTASFLEEDPSSNNPTPDTATVTLSDLSLYLAYHLSSTATPAATNPAARIVRPAATLSPSLGDSSCLAAKDLRIAPCIVTEALNDGLKDVADQLDTQLLKQAGKYSPARSRSPAASTSTSPTPKSFAGCRRFISRASRSLPTPSSTSVSSTTPPASPRRRVCRP